MSVFPSPYAVPSFQPGLASRLSEGGHEVLRYKTDQSYMMAKQPYQSSPPPPDRLSAEQLSWNCWTEAPAGIELHVSKGSSPLEDTQLPVPVAGQGLHKGIPTILTTVTKRIDLPGEAAILELYLEGEYLWDVRVAAARLPAPLVCEGAEGDCIVNENWDGSMELRFELPKFDVAALQASLKKYG